MCWKQEWASAIGNLQRAIERIEKAREKLVRRKERNDRTLTRRRDRWSQMTIGELAMKNEAGIDECNAVISSLESQQDRLYEMIQTYGINNQDHSERLEELMGNYRHAGPKKVDQV